MDELDSQPHSDLTMHEYNDSPSITLLSESQQSILLAKPSTENNHCTPSLSSQPTDHVTASDAIPDLIMPDEYGDLLAGLGDDDLNDFDGVDDFGDEVIDMIAGASGRSSQEDKVVNKDGMSGSRQVKVSHSERLQYIKPLKTHSSHP